MDNVSFFDGANRFVIDKPIRLIELFAGIGAQAKALENLGVDFEHYRICEFDKYAVASYNAVHGTNFATSDITKITADYLGIVDTDKYCYIMTYSFPCQDLSLAGKQRGMGKGAGTRSGLLWEVERLLDECKELPQVLVMENVPQVIGTKNIEHFAKWQEKLESLGYKNKWQILNAKDFGVPQNRERCFMVSVLGDYYYEFPKKIKLEKRLKDVLESEVDEKYYLSDKQIENLMGQADKKRAKGLGFKFEPLNGESIAHTVTCHETHNLECNWVQVSHGDCKGGLRKIDICPTITTSAFQENNFVIDFYNKSIRNNGLAGTITTGAATNGSGTFCVVKNNRIRKLTPKECWRLMGFGDADVEKTKSIGMSDTQLYKQAGNSIVVNVLEAIMKNLLKNA